MLNVSTVWEWPVVVLGLALVALAATSIVCVLRVVARKARWKPGRTRDLMVLVAVFALMLSTGRFEVRPKGEYPGVTAGFGGMSGGFYRKRTLNAIPFTAFAIEDPRAWSCLYLTSGDVCLWVGMGPLVSDTGRRP